MDYTIKELPESEQPREKLARNTASDLTNVELLSIILRTGIKGKNVKELSAEILNSISLDRLAERSQEDLESFRGISEVKAGQLIALGELARRMKREERETVESLSDAAKRLEDMKLLEQEKMRILYLNSGNELLGEDEFDGTVGKVNFDPKKILGNAIRSSASAFIIAHNHPSGKAEPTEKDIQATRKMKDASESVGLDLLDHIIVGKEFTSIRNSEARNLWK